MSAATVRLEISFLNRFGADRRRVDQVDDFVMDFEELPNHHTIVPSFTAVTMPIEIRIERTPHGSGVESAAKDEYALTMRMIRDAWAKSAKDEPRFAVSSHCVTVSILPANRDRPPSIDGPYEIRITHRVPVK